MNRIKSFLGEEVKQEKRASIELTKSEANTIYSGMSLLTLLNENGDIKLDEEAKMWYSHIKDLFASFITVNY
jgi:hypothetical protein